ncbi:MAG: copper resistance protein CopC/CopD [Actinobacteria bacterium]|nr:copper resistance protein CopC/CopD [Actinomycetota bacterium]
MRRFSSALALGLLLALLAPAGAFAHARLEATSPPQGATVKKEPAAVVFTFDEPVEGNFGAVRAYDSKGERVDEGDAFHPGGEGQKLGVHLEPGLPDGSYTATYRVVSADGHIVAGGYVFSIGKAGRAPTENVAELLGGQGSGPVTEAAFGIARGLEYLAIALAVGGLAFLLIVFTPALAALGEGTGEVERRFLQRGRWLLWAAAGLGLLGAAASIVLEGAEAAGVSGFSALKWTIVEATLETRFGTVWGWAFVAWALFALALPLLLGRRRARLVLALPLAFLVLAPGLAGHASTQSPVGLNFPVNVVHVAAMAIWLGGLATLLLALPAATRALEPAARSRLLAANLGRFSQLALIAVAAILLTGVVQAYVYVRHPGDLLSTGYGRAVLAKFLLLLVVIGFAAYNRRRSVPELRRIAAAGETPGRAGLMLRRALRAELAVLLVVLGVTAALASYAPPISAQGGPFSTMTTLGPAQLELSVDPAQVGENQVHVYLFDSKTGAQYTKGKELKITATLPAKEIGPLQLEPEPAGPGHYVVPAALLNAPGSWRLDFILRVSAFEQFEKSVEVGIG